MEDKSIIKTTDTVDVNASYINDCIMEVCLKGDSLTKYKRMIEKRYDAEFYQKCGIFVKEVKRSVNRKKFTQTSIANLNHLANEVYVTSSTIETLIDHYTKIFADDEKKNKKSVHKSVKHEEEKDIEEVAALMKKVAEAEAKKAEVARKRKETAERKKKEAAERMRLMSESIHKEVEEKLKKKEEEEKRKAEERRKRTDEHRRQKKLEEEKLRKEEKKRQMEQNAKIQHEEERNKLIMKWLIAAAIVVIALCVFIPAFRYVVAELIGGLLALVVVVFIIYLVFSFVVGLFE